MLSNFISFVGDTARNQVPMITMIVLVLMSIPPFYLPHYGWIAINFSLIGLFYWSVYKPQLIHLFTAFLVGLFYDFLAGVPAGMFALIFVVSRALLGIYCGGLGAANFLSLWLGFFLFVVGTSFTGWLASSLWYGALIDPVSVLFHTILTVASFPFGAVLLIWISRKVYRAG